MIWESGKPKITGETPITKEELMAGDYQLMGIYTHIQVEKRIIDKLITEWKFINLQVT